MSSKRKSLIKMECVSQPPVTHTPMPLEINFSIYLSLFLAGYAYIRILTDCGL